MSGGGVGATRARRWIRLLPILAIALLFVAVIASGELRRLSLSDLEAHREALVRVVLAHPVASLAAYVALFALVVAACVPGPSVMSVTGGLLFGPFMGGAAALAGLLGGSTLVFLACRTAFGDWAARRGGPSIARVEAGFSRNAFSYLLAMRLMPVAPVFVVNLAAGLARVRLGAFLLATLIGSAPSTFIFAGLGSGLGRVVRHHAHVDMRLLARPDVALPLMGLAALSLTPALWRIWRARRPQA
jgi:uncharacterized membrane protein YdjX (TVP38/TMEM64 family)